MKTLNNLQDRKNISHRMAGLTPDDTAHWGRMSVHQMVCHLNDSYKIPLGEKTAGEVSGFKQRRLIKRLALWAPLNWPKGVATIPEVEQGKGGSLPLGFREDVAALLLTLDRFCNGLPSPCVSHPIFGEMTERDWMRWGFLHADHHLRQFGR